MHVGEQVRRLRVFKGLTQRDLAKQISSLTRKKFWQGQVFSVEQGIRNIKIDELQALTRIFNIPLNFLFRTDPLPLVVDVSRFKLPREDESKNRFFELILRETFKRR